ncbi:MULTISPECIES: 7TM diverse intracellular signaling domain-containing protein [Flammeovirga]|uniref:7TMR-DISM extracellular 2 n=1 Tax=Flammeovirga agarivorans TaxID=2726742 RepID=A0A7X8XVT9_9BACT|nr:MULTISPECIES: 7TM diverse intracellular signaling domain-containing protein [Flammeovirga]NLR91652.1 hypothetical protein [Flammeovirga agarivorans]
MIRSVQNVILTLLFLLSLQPLSYAQNLNSNDLVIHLDDASNEQLLNLEKIPFYKDNSRVMTYADIVGDSLEFKSAKKYSKENFDTKATYWMKFYIDIQKFNNKSWTFELYDQAIDDVVVFFVETDGEVKKEVMGDMYNFDQRPFAHKNFIIPLNNNIDYSQPIYIKVQSNHKVDLHINFRSTERLVYHATLEYLWFGIYYGAILIMAIYNFMLWLSIRESKYLVYILHIFTVGLFNASADGTGFQFVWYDNPIINSYAVNLLSIFCALSVTFLIKEVLIKEAKNAKYVRYINYLLIGQTLILAVDLLIINSQANSIILLLCILILLYYTVNVYREKLISIYFVFGLLMLLAGTILSILKAHGMIPFNMLTQYSLRGSLLMEMLLFSYALYDSLRVLKENEKRSQLQLIEHQKKTEMMQKQVIEEQEKTMRLKNKVNEELETKVQERTASLMESERKLKELNQKLQEKTDHLNLINQTLDVNNYKLKKSIIKERENRFVHKIISLEEFKELFPDHLSCKRYLDKQKWEQGYECKQCKNTNYSKGNQSFSRRCSKCGYVESVTSNTVFHSVKFDLTKAFYLSYITRYHEKDFTNVELGTQLEMSRNTVAKFKTKILSAKEKKLLLPTFSPEIFNKN